MAYKGMREDVEHANARTRLARTRTSYKARRLYFHDLTIRLRDKGNTMRHTRIRARVHLDVLGNQAAFDPERRSIIAVMYDYGKT